MVADLMETCIDDVLSAPAVPTVTATDEAGPSNAYATPSVTGEDPPSLTGEPSKHTTKWIQSDNENYIYLK